MLNHHTSLSEDLEQHVETSADQYRGSVFVIPYDAPIPNELKDVQVQQGTLLKRLAILDKPDVEDFVILPLKGEEMLELGRVWILINSQPKVVVLENLPGARYDVLFDQGTRAVGLPSVDWPVLAAGLARAVVEIQRHKDSAVWASSSGPDASPDPRVGRLNNPRKAGPLNDRDAPLADPAKVPIADDDEEIA